MKIRERAGLVAAIPSSVIAAGFGYYVGRKSATSSSVELDDRTWRILDVLREQWLIVDGDDRVVRQGKQLDALGLVRHDGLRFREIRDVARRARRKQATIETSIQLELGRDKEARRFLDVRATPVGDGLILIVVDDQTHAQRVEETRRDFVANVSHELKTPVGGLRLLAEAIEDAADDQDAVKRFSARMRIESVRLANLVQEIVDLSRLQVTNPSESATVVHLDAIAARAVADMQVIADAREIELALRCEEVPAIVGDEEMLLTAVRNLISNAINYSESNTQVTVEVCGGTHEVLVCVIDQGMGISAADQSRIFERFYRVDPARSRQTGGTGLGLAIVKHVAANHDGEVRVRSEVGVGSTFEMVIPTGGAGTPHAGQEEKA